MAVLFKKSYVSALSDNVKKRNKYAWEKGVWTGKPPIGIKKRYLITENILLLSTIAKPTL